MKIALFLAGLVLLLVIAFDLNESEARVSNVDVQQQLKNETVTCVYEGYRNHTVNVLLNDGTRAAYSFKSNETLLRHISNTRLSTRVTITVENGMVVRFEEAYK